MKKILLIALIAFSFNAIAQVPSYVPTNGLLGWYPFNGNANDMSSYQLNGIPTNVTLTTDRNGNANSAYRFHQTDSYIKLNDTTNVAHYSISCWLNSFSINDTGMVFCKANMNNVDIHGFYTQRGYNGFISTRHQFANDNQNICEANNNYAYTDSTWHYITVTYDGISIITYIDAQPIDTLMCSVNISTPNIKYIGGAPSSDWGCTWNGNVVCGACLDGKIDDFGFWNRALTPQEITTLYNTSLLTGVESVNKNIIDIYPNPTTNNITINCKETIANGYTLSITNSLGVGILSEQFSKSTYTTSIPNSVSGLYFLYISDSANNIISVQKLIIQ